MKHYADLAFAGYTDAADGTRRLQAAIADFLAQPSAQRLDAARAAWLEARRPYLQTEVFRFCEGPIDKVERFVNSWPVDENCIESVDGKSGIVDDAATYPELTSEALIALNEKDGETNITTGFHVIEFLLWGRDTDASGPGRRPFTDYLSSEKPGAAASCSRPGTPIAEATPTRRRRGYLQSAAEALVRHLEEVALAWAEGRPGNYRAMFLSLPTREALGLILKGMATLSGAELSGERLTVAYATRDQENEHSCFSDSTQQDVVYDALGIENVGTGRYVRSSGGTLTGPSLCDLISGSDKALAKQLRMELGRAVALARKIPSPFDQAFLGKDSAPGRVAIKATVEALEAQAATISRAASVLAVTSSGTAQSTE